MKRLNGWQRIGVVLSILWAIGAAIYNRNNQVHIAQTVLHHNLTGCLDDHRLGIMRDGCNEKAVSAYELMLQISAGNVADILFYSLAPVAIGWIAIYLVIRIFRWVRAGFRRNPDE